MKSEFLRPQVVLFGEMLPEAGLVRYGALQTLGIELVVRVGASSLFPYITMPVEFARDAGMPTVEINTGHTDISEIVTHRLEMDYDEVLEGIGDHWN